MKDIEFPLHLQFKISTLANDFIVKDASGNEIAYARQKMFKLKEAVRVFKDSSKSDQIYEIKADKWLDFSAAYTIFNANREPLGKIARKGWRSMWKAEYEIIDNNNQPLYTIKEDSAWVRVMDSLFGEIPILGFFTGYLFNPSYSILSVEGSVLYILKKLPSFWGRKFSLEKPGSVAPVEQVASNELVTLGYMMMLMLERGRG